MSSEVAPTQEPSTHSPDPLGVESLDLDPLEPAHGNVLGISDAEHQLLEDFILQSTKRNSTDDHAKLLECFHQYVKSRNDPGHNEMNCPVKFDGVSCWPETPGGMLRSIKCFEEFRGIPYNSSENATLYCHPNGTWAEKASYFKCLEALPEPPQQDNSIRTIYYVGNSLSLASVIIALWIFISFKDLRCLRNTIHTNLLFTYLLHNLFWIVYASTQVLLNVTIGCSFYVIINYFNLTNFMWMFVEGFYLYMLVVKTFSVENIKLRVYALLGWGVPIPIIVTWVIVKSQMTSADANENGDQEGLEVNCPFIPESLVDWIHYAPVLFVLSINILFLIRIMWVLITKLRSANTVETQRYRKATKALLVLIPLLGLTYLLVIALPKVLEHPRTILLSTQGFWVALFYCFLNSEVQNSIRHHIERWKTAQSLAENRSTSVRHGGRDSSPRSRLDGLRIFRSKRESLCSEVTMTTFVGNGYNNTSHQPGHQATLPPNTPSAKQTLPSSLHSTNAASLTVSEPNLQAPSMKDAAL